MRHSFFWTIEREDAEGNGIEYEVEIDGTYHFGAPQTWTDPADPDEFEYDILGLPEGITLTDKEHEAIEDWAYNNPPEDDYDDYYEDD